MDDIDILIKAHVGCIWRMVLETKIWAFGVLLVPAVLLLLGPHR